MNPAEIFDRSVYDDLVVELSIDDAAEVLCTFLADTAGKLERLSAGRLYSAVMRREAHSIKSSSATLGFFELSRRAAEMEASARDADPERLQGFVCELQQSFTRVRRLAANVLREGNREVVR